MPNFKPRPGRVSKPSFLGFPNGSAQAASADTGVEAAGVIQMHGWEFTGPSPSNHIGSNPVWREVTLGDDGARNEQIFYIGPDGDTYMASYNQVGRNDQPPKMQPVGSFHFDIDAVTPAADVTMSAAGMIAAAVTAGARVSWYDANGDTQDRAVVASDMIGGIDFDLKPVGGHGDNAATQVTSTTADGSFVDNGGVSDLDGGGSRQAGNKTDPNGFMLQSSFESVTVKSGSVAVVALDIIGPLV